MFSEVRQRGHAAMLGLAVGDALGWPIEDRGNRIGGTAKLKPDYKFMDWRRREGGRYAPHEQVVRAGEYSDDTQLALAVARSRSIGEYWWEYLTQVELPAWTVYERGGGGASKRAAQSWLYGRPPWTAEKSDAIHRYFQAGGAGAVMRCLPHCFVTAPQDTEELNQALDLDGITTHGHPRALVGSRLYGAAISWALYREEPLPYGGLVERLLEDPSWQTMPTEAYARIQANLSNDQAKAWEEEWIQAAEETIHLLHLSREGLAQGAIAVDRPVLDALGAFGASRGCGTIMAASAIFLASRYASQPQQGLLAAAFARGSDTDTLASLTAALLGALNGSDWLQPLADEVQDSAYILQVADELLDRRPSFIAGSRWSHRDRTKLYRWLDKAAATETTELGPLGDMTILDVRDYEARSMFVRSWEITTQVGQTVQIKRYDKGRDGYPRWRQIELSSATTSGPPKLAPRAGVVLQVADLHAARQFYEQIVCLEVQRATDDYVSFGWLALERSNDDQPSRQLDLSGDGQIIRVYMTEESLVDTRTRLNTSGLAVTDAPQRFKGRAFRCTDRDGHAVEFVAYNGRPSVISPSAIET
jgi:ADP-ribosylglycohydrolase